MFSSWDVENWGQFQNMGLCEPNMGFCKLLDVSVSVVVCGTHWIRQDVHLIFFGCIFIDLGLCRASRFTISCTVVL
jgi:hypothetical protein